MTRLLESNSVIALPRLDANQAMVLAQQLTAAALDEKGDPRPLPEAVEEALGDVKEDRAALQDVLGPQAQGDVRAIDKLEDNAIAALILILAGWSRVRGQLDLGDIAVEVGTHVGVEDGLGFINMRPRDEYGIVDTKLNTITRENLDGKLEKLGLGPLLAHLREVHEQYGKALGMVHAVPGEERAVVRPRLDALTDSLRHYVTAVLGSVQRKKPATKELADALLRPLTTWQADPVRKAPKEEGTTGAATGSSADQG
ncbi:hypothetical protein [Polyangium jinanense]|uniref:Uncharacterized protein n=1 Tax=Polyangium jinanense TaxID=2829994 RepID=A0A9X4AYP6_9BACT|nr:hypothetical protein [Polyangium jinanense]MDC3958505.1 hypothetical protein [Polyangium jinanense]MDC3987322.1 hypothetical protein [Polyangium jinanense]